MSSTVTDSLMSANLYKFVVEEFGGVISDDDGAVISDDSVVFLPDYIFSNDPSSLPFRISFVADSLVDLVQKKMGPMQSLENATLLMGHSISRLTSRSCGTRFTTPLSFAESLIFQMEFLMRTRAGDISSLLFDHGFFTDWLGRRNMWIKASPCKCCMGVLCVPFCLRDLSCLHIALQVVYKIVQPVDSRAWNYDLAFAGDVGSADRGASDQVRSPSSAQPSSNKRGKASNCDSDHGSHGFSGRNSESKHLALGKRWGASSLLGDGQLAKAYDFNVSTKPMKYFPQGYFDAKWASLTPLQVFEFVKLTTGVKTSNPQPSYSALVDEARTKMKR